MKFSFSPSSTDLKKSGRRNATFIGGYQIRKGTGDSGGVSGKCSAYHRTKRRSPAYYLSGTGTLLSGTELGGTSSGGYLEHEKVNLYTFQKTE